MKLEKGSLTVEAALIMPLLLFVLFSVIYFAFFLHDKCRIQGMLDKMIHRAGLSLNHEGDLETGKIYYDSVNERDIFYSLWGNYNEEKAQIKQYMQKNLSEGLIFTKVRDLQVDRNAISLTVSVEAEVDISLKSVDKLLNSYKYMWIKETYPIHNPAETIRMVEVILDLGCNAKALGRLKNCIDAIMNRR